MSDFNTPAQLTHKPLSTVNANYIIIIIIMTSFCLFSSFLPLSIFLWLFPFSLNSNLLSFSLWPFQLGEVGALRLQVAMSRGLHSSPHSDKGEQGPIVWVSSAVAPKSCVNNEHWHFNLALSHWQRKVGPHVLWVPWCCSISRTNKCLLKSCPTMWKDLGGKIVKGYVNLQHGLLDKCVWIWSS